MVFIGVIAVYNQTACYNAQKKIELVEAEMAKVSESEHAIERALMPGNDYIITGDKRYEDEFRKVSAEVDRHLNGLDMLLSAMREDSVRNVKKEEDLLLKAHLSWKNIKELSMGIFAIPEPVGSAVAKELMEEMDYKWGSQASISLARWHDIDINEFEKVMDEFNAAWMRSWFIMGAAIAVLSVVGIFLASHYSKKIVIPIRDLYDGAKRITGGDFEFHIEVSARDEIGQLANQFNVMGERLKESYCALEEKIRVRTKDLEHERAELKERVNELERFMKVAVAREFKVKELTDEVERLRRER